MEEPYSTEVLAFWILGAFALFIIFSITILLFVRIHIRKIRREQERLIEAERQHKMTLLQSSVEVQERERDRIAQELHDDVLNRLNIVSLGIRTKMPEKKLQHEISQCMETTRKMTYDLCPPLIKSTPLPDLLAVFIGSLHPHIQTKVRHDIRENIDFPEMVKLNLLRIIQEIGSNVLRHAQASTLHYSLRLTHQTLSICIIDDGVGFDTSVQSNGLGIRNIQLRSRLLNAKYRFKRNQTSGMSYMLSLNFNHLL